MKVQPVIFLSVIVTSIVLVNCGKKRNNGPKREHSLVEQSQENHVNDKFYRSQDRNLKWRLKTNYFKKPKKVKKVKKVLHSSEQDSFEYDSISPVEQKLQKDKRPNIILFLTDDQDVELGSLQYMPKVEKILRNGGAFFPNSYVSTPMCCPSRSSLLTGLYVHNHKVLTNSDNCSSTYWQTEHEPRTFGAYLATAGYRTGYFGKYLNKYNGSYVPPGWRNWAGLVMNSKYYNYTINRNGQKVKYGANYSKDYYPDLVTNDSIKFIHEWKENYSASPMLLVMSFPAPHGPEDSAPQYSDMYFNVTSHRTPAYDFAPNPDKQWILRWVNKMEPVHHQFTDLLMTKRLQTLQTVDDAVERVYKELKAIGELDNTYIFYTSDHGYHLGQFGLVKGKSFPFEFDIRVPFLVRGPGIKPGTTVLNIVANIDLAPTFLDIAGIPQPSHMDGSSFLRFLRKKSDLSNPHDQKRWRDTILLERGKPPPSELAPLNTVEDIPISTPQPTTTKATESPDRGLKDNEGAEGDDGDDIVREYPARPPKFEMLAIECQKEQYQSPCEPFQKWECLQVGDHWKMRRCPFPTVYSLESRCNCKKKKISQRKTINKEKKMQREFLKEFVNRDINQYKPRFLKMKRTKRGLFDDDPFFAALEDKPISDIVAEGELDEVDLILEGINEEISSLESYNDTAKATTPAISVFDSCTMINGGNVTCRSEVYEDVQQWRQSKESIEKQILLLKKQLEEMQMIRRHLKSKRPSPARSSPPPSKKPELNDTSIEDGFEEYVIDPMAPVEVLTLDDDHTDFDSDTESDGDDMATDLVGNGNVTLMYDIAVHNASSVDGHGIDGDSIYEPEENHNGTQEKSEDCVCDKRLYKRWRKKQEELRRQEQKRRLKEQRLKKKQKKLRRKLGREQAGCNLDKMNCFNHDNSHWRTEPLWQGGQFCVCMNANNNTYWCLRTINATHNFLYCEFITGFVTFYDMKIDQYQLRNIAHTLSEDQLDFLHSVLVKYRLCKGEECNVNIGTVWRKEMTAKKKQKSKKGHGYEETQDFPAPGNENVTVSGVDLKPGKKKQLTQWGRHRRKEVDLEEEV